MALDRVLFTAHLNHPEHGEFDLQVTLPVRTCLEHRPGGEPDEDTPNPPHIYSESSYHQDYAVCLAVQA